MTKNNSTTPKSRALQIISIIIVILLCLACVGVTVWFYVFANTPYEFSLDDYLSSATLVWHDEFDGNAVDLSKWNVEGANEAEGRTPRRGGYWSADSVRVDGGNLIIDVTKRDDGFFYAGAVTTHDKYESKYGYYETRCQLPKNNGIWAAFWMMPVDIDGLFASGETDARVAGAEIDIFEAAFFPKSVVQQNVHIGGYGTKHQSFPNVMALFGDYGDIYDDFHTYGLYWDENIYIFYIDGKRIWSTDCQNNVSQIDSAIYLTTEVGGYVKDGVPVPGTSWGDHKSPDCSENDWSKNDVRFLVDYVRHYKNGNGNGNV